MLGQPFLSARGGLGTVSLSLDFARDDELVESSNRVAVLISIRTGTSPIPT